MADTTPELPSTTRREFLGQATATGVAVGLLVATDVNRADASPTQPTDTTKTGKAPLTASVTPDNISRWTSQTLLNDGGGLRQPISSEQYQAWLTELKSLPTRLSSRRSALLNLWVGEYAMTTGQEPRKALHHFRLAKQRTKADDALYGWAGYNECLALAFDSQYNESAEGFAHLLYGHTKTGAKPLHGFDWQVAGGWLRRMSARASEFNRLGEMGIPRPPSLDTICGAGGLAVCLRSLKLSYDKKTVLANVRVTGRGSTLGDLLAACPKLV